MAGQRLCMMCDRIVPALCGHVGKKNDRGGRAANLCDECCRSHHTKLRALDAQATGEAWVNFEMELLR